IAPCFDLGNSGRWSGSLVVLGSWDVTEVECPTRPFDADSILDGPGISLDERVPAQRSCQPRCVNLPFRTRFRSRFFVDLETRYADVAPDCRWHSDPGRQCRG